MELHDVPANVRLQGAVVVRQVGQGHGPGADGATARTSGADPPRPGDLGRRRRLRRADCLHFSSRLLDSNNSFIRYGVLPQFVVLARVSPLFQLFCCVLGTSGVALVSSLWVLHFLGSSFGNDFLGFRRNKGILLWPSDATSPLSLKNDQISRKSRDRIGCPLKASKTPVSWTRT